MKSNSESRHGRCLSCVAWGVISISGLLGGTQDAMGAVVDIGLIAVSTPSGSDIASSLPTTQSAVAPGSSFQIEVWAQTTHPDGLTSVSLDIAFNPALATVVNITHTAVFSELQNGTIDNTNGLVDDLSGSHLGPCADGVGVSPTWARVAVIEMSAIEKGSLLFEAIPTGAPAFGTAICAVGDIDPSEVAFGSISIQIIEGDIPAVSTWGLCVMALLVLVAGTVLGSRVQDRSMHPVA